MNGQVINLTRRNLGTSLGFWKGMIGTAGYCFKRGSLVICLLGLLVALQRSVGLDNTAQLRRTSTKGLEVQVPFFGEVLTPCRSIDFTPMVYNSLYIHRFHRDSHTCLMYSIPANKIDEDIIFH